MVNISDILSIARERTGKTLGAMATELGVSPTSLRKAEKMSLPGRGKLKANMRDQPQKFIEAYQLAPEEQSQFMERLGIGQQNTNSLQKKGVNPFALILAEIMELSAEQRQKLVRILRAYDQSENMAE